MTESHEYYMSLALAQARLAWDHGEIPVGAIVTDSQGRVIAQGFNQTITTDDPTAHAEIVAMRNAGRVISDYRLTGLNLYVTLEPCTMCCGAIIHARFSKVFFGAPDPRTGGCGSVFDILGDTRHNHHAEVLGGVLKDECSELLKAFFKERRRLQKEIKKSV